MEKLLAVFAVEDSGGFRCEALGQVCQGAIAGRFGERAQDLKTGLDGLKLAIWCLVGHVCISRFYFAIIAKRGDDVKQIIAVIAKIFWGYFTVEA
jgi:hypothetical protein